MWQKLWQWCTRLFSKKPVEPAVLKSIYTGPTDAVANEEPVTPVVAEIRRAKAKRERRRIRNLNYKTKGAFGSPKAFKRDRGD